MHAASAGLAPPPPPHPTSVLEPVAPALDISSPQGPCATSADNSAALPLPILLPPLLPPPTLLHNGEGGEEVLGALLAGVEDDGSGSDQGACGAQDMQLQEARCTAQRTAAAAEAADAALARAHQVRGVQLAGEEGPRGPLVPSAGRC